ncbi:MAG: ribosome recycling factor [Deltaproteobacteria bacterium]|nr:ribosome recycling factor [Deltaproteobacteria bacterium]
MVNDILNDLKDNMNGAMEALKRDLAKRRTGRANASLLDGIKVDYYGTPSPINQIASVQVPDPRLITIKPWEKNMVQAIEKAVQQSNLGLNPSSDGEVIRLPIPPLTGERRNQLVKDVKKLGEEAKVGVRNQRRDANEMLKELEKDKEISEDDLRKGMARVQELTDEYVKKVDEIVAGKEKEIMEG